MQTHVRSHILVPGESPTVIREFESCNDEFVRALLADIAVHCPDFSEFIFHGYPPAGIAALRTLNQLSSPPEPIKVPHISDHADDLGAWIAFDCTAIDAYHIAHTFSQFDHGTIYVPINGCNVSKFAQLLIEQTMGLHSLFRLKTYKNFLALSVFVATQQGYYILSK